MIISASRKNTEATATITKTIAVVMAVSRRDGHVTFEVSARTSCMNLKGLNLGIIESERTLSLPNPAGWDRRVDPLVG